MPNPPATRLTMAELNSFPAGDFVALVGGIFEHSPWIAETAAGRRPFASVTALHQAMTAIVSAAALDRQWSLIRAHPDLAGRLAQHGRLTAESTREQASAGLASATPGMVQRIQTLNAAYRERFDFPFVICARLNNVESIVAAMEERLQHDDATELSTALAEIYKIAQLRLDDLVAS